MVVTEEWKYIFMANGGREQLFHRREDPNELSNIASTSATIRRDLRALAVDACRKPGASDALDGDDFRSFPFRARPRTRLYQFDQSFGVKGFPEHPKDALEDFDALTFRRRK
jgi:choline-sulfatase